MTWRTIQIPYIFNHKQAFSVRFSDYHLKTRPVNWTQFYHLNTRLVGYSDGYCKCPMVKGMIQISIRYSDDRMNSSYFGVKNLNVVLKLNIYKPDLFSPFKFQVCLMVLFWNGIGKLPGFSNGRPPKWHSKCLKHLN